MWVASVTNSSFDLGDGVIMILRKESVTYHLAGWGT